MRVIYVSRAAGYLTATPKGFLKTLKIAFISGMLHDILSCLIEFDRDDTVEEGCALIAQIEEFCIPIVEGVILPRLQISSARCGND